MGAPVAQGADWMKGGANHKILLSRKLNRFKKESQGNSNEWILLDLTYWL